MVYDYRVILTASVLAVGYAYNQYVFNRYVRTVIKCIAKCANAIAVVKTILA